MLAIRLPEEVEKRLDALARRTGRTKTFYAREAIIEHIGDLEIAYRTAETSPRPARVPRQAAESVPAPSFTSRWRGRFRPAAKTDERYQALAKKYL
ncbi:MAG TPA: TraY domain-containing protein [Bryobacteraceae bacterium]|nr:TraY domain-containing protein [Bryobacteraceae bacterium]